MIVYKNVTRKYGQLIAVDRLNLEIPDKDFFGLLGPNSAGKTTIIRMTTALTPITEGSIEIDGESVHRDLSHTKRRFGIVPQYSNLEGELTAWQNLEYHGRLYGMPGEKRRNRIRELLDFAELSDRAEDIAKTFSGGMQRRLMIIKALMHQPDILLLDEPTVGLDAGARRKIWDLLRTLNEGGLTVFLTTHYLEEAQALCRRVGLIDKGKLMKLDRPAAIIGEIGKYVLEYFVDGHTCQCFFEEKEEAVKAAGKICGDFQVREANLEDAFLRLTNRGLGRV